jgi:hypothetical protein
MVKFVLFMCYNFSNTIHKFSEDGADATNVFRCIYIITLYCAYVQFLVP